VTRGTPPETRATPLVRKLSRFVLLPEEAVERLEELQRERVAVEARARLVDQDKPYQHLSVLVQGSGIRYRVLPDGRRQIVNFVVAGDVIGLRGCIFQRAANSVALLEQSVLAPLTTARVFSLLGEFPALRAVMFWLAALEQTLLVERLVVLARGSAYERVAQLLLELRERLRWVGLAEERTFRFPLTQRLIADSLGLSTVHVNRILHRLADEGLVRVSAGSVTLFDSKALAKAAGLEGDGSVRRQPASNFLVTLGSGSRAFVNVRKTRRP